MKSFSGSCETEALGLPDLALQALDVDVDFDSHGQLLARDASGYDLDPVVTNLVD